MKFYPADWRADAMLRLCSIGARGLWTEMMCIMHEAERYGSLLVNGRRIDKKQLAALAGVSEKECTSLLLELEGNGVFSRDEDGTIYSRRMRRDFEKAVKDKTNGADGGNPTIRRGTVPKEQRVRPYRRSDAPEKTLRIFAKNGGKCHWCNAALLFDPDGSPNGFHVDHLLPICDGGTNDEDNLIPSCATCNHKRARMDDPTASPVNVGNRSDVKAQKPEARSHSQKEEPSLRSGSARQRGARLPEDWTPSPDDWREATAKLGQQGSVFELSKFRDYWKAQPGQRGVKLDWNATFRNWIRNARGPANGQRTANPRATGHDALLAVATRKAREIVGDGDVAGPADEAEFPFGGEPFGGRAQGNRDPAFRSAAGYDGGKPGAGAVLEGEIIAPDQDAAGLSSGWRRH